VATGWLDPGGLDDGDLLLAQALAHDVEAARQRGVAKGAVVILNAFSALRDPCSGGTAFPDRLRKFP